ncbi:MAG: type II toxin-antitoxin system RelE/ParE family toxin [Ignavibacteria bacterium]|nr:type II toxin-antitoxin system RelE/ParE family toxin [Ignavibacteria bacterium]
MKRELLFFDDYFLDFYSKQDLKTKEKIDFVLDLIRNVERVPIKFLKYLEGTDSLYEIRVLTYKSNIRILSFLDEGNLVNLINGFIKKTDKTPKKELELGIKLKEEYFIEKFERKRK